MNQKLSVAAIGDVSDKSTFSGTPYHFWMAAVAMGFPVDPWQMDLAKVSWSRKLWNLGRLVMFERPGGFQYSKAFAKKIIREIPKELLASEVISFNQHFPPVDDILDNGGKLNIYIDATFKQLLDRYKVSDVLGKKIIDETLKIEKRTFELANKIFTMQEWAKNSVVNDYGISPGKVVAVLPGANIIFPKDYSVRQSPTQNFGPGAPLVLGFVGKDWKRKGLNTLKQVRDILEKRGHNVIIRCAGHAPSDFKNTTGIDFVGFIDKSNDNKRFIDFLESCHIGCLYSEAEFSSISVLEFISVGRPVAGFVVDGMSDLFIPSLSLRNVPGDSIEKIADGFERYIVDESFRSVMNAEAIRYSSHVRWERSVKDIMKHLGYA